MPEWIVRRDPNTILVSISRSGYINKVWVHDSFKGPLSPDDLVGLSLEELFSTEEVQKMLSWIDSVISSKNIGRGQILLNMEVSHKRRKFRLLPDDDKNVLAYIIK